jgi:hypothetical protein
MLGPSKKPNLQAARDTFEGTDTGLTIFNGRPPSGLMFFLGLDHNAMLSLSKDPNLLIFSGHGRWSDYSS